MSPMQNNDQDMGNRSMTETERNQEFSPTEYPLHLADPLIRSGILPLLNMGLTGSGSFVGHLDSGIDPSQKDLITRMTAFAEIDNSGQVILNQAPIDETGHGTRTAGLVSGGCRKRRLLGVAPDSSLIVGKVLEGGNTVVRILSGLNWLMGNEVRVVLFCGGFPTANPILGPMLLQMRKAGILVICPIGNQGQGNYRQPGDDPSVLSVGAIDSSDKPAKFSGSCIGRFSHEVKAPDILAPGVAIPCISAKGGVTQSSGTSMAAAIVAGVVALLLEAETEASADQLYDAICYGSKPLDNETRKHARFGVLNAESALKYLREHKNKKTLPRPERLPLVNSGWRDPRLKYQLTHSGPEDTIMAVYVLYPELEADQWGRAVREFLAYGFKKLDQDSVKYLPGGRALIINATSTVHLELIENPLVTYASAADAGRLLIPNK